MRLLAAAAAESTLVLATKLLEGTRALLMALAVPAAWFIAPLAGKVAHRPQVALVALAVSIQAEVGGRQLYRGVVEAVTVGEVSSPMSF